MTELSYSKNTLFLIFAGIFSQFFGVILKILLSYRLKEQGMAVYQVAISVYSAFLTPVLCGMPLAITRFISKNRAEKNEDVLKSGVSFSFFAMCALGAACSILMLVSRRFFALALKEPAAEYAISALSPAVFFVALGAFSKSWFEGSANMLPCAVSSGAESVLKLLFAYILTAIFGIFSIKYAAMGAALSITLGEAFATLILFLFMPSVIKSISRSAKNGGVCGEILAYALPVTAYAIILNSLNLLETSVIRNSLLAVRFSGNALNRLLSRYPAAVFDTVKHSGRLSQKGADWLYGAYFGYALTVIRFPAGLLRIFCVPFFPLAAKCFAENNITLLSRLVFRLIKIMLMLSLPVCALFIIFAPQITAIIFGSSVYSVMLAFTAPLLVLAPISELFGTVCYAYGKTFPPFLFGFISSILSIILSASLIRVPHLNILGVAASSVISAAAELLMLCFFVRRTLKKASASYRR